MAWPGCDRRHRAEQLEHERGGVVRPLHRVQMRALDHAPALARERMRGRVAALAHLGRAGAGDEADVAARRMLAQQRGQVVRQRVVEAGLGVARDREDDLAAVAARLVEARAHVRGQHARIPARERGLGGEMRVHGLARGPFVAATLRDRARPDAPDQAGALGHVHAVRAPAGDDRRVEHHDATDEVGPLAGREQADQAAERVADQHRAGELVGDEEVGQLVAQARPVAGDRVARVGAEARRRLDAPAGGSPHVEQRLVGAGGKAVRVGEDDRAGRGLRQLSRPGCGSS